MTEFTILCIIDTEANTMEISASEKIRILAKRKGKSLGDIADLTEQSRQNLSNKMNRDNFTIAELKKVAAALGCTVSICFTDTETGEQI